MLEKRVLGQSNNIQSFKEVKAHLIHPWSSATVQFLNYLDDLRSSNGWVHLKVQRLSILYGRRVYQVWLASFPAIWSNSPPGHNQLTAQLLSSPKCPEHTALDLIRKLWSRSSIYGQECPDATCIYGHWCLNMVFVMDKLWLAQKSNIKTPLRSD